MRIYVSATMRSGNSLISNILSIHKELLVMQESIHFFRLFYNFYNPLDRKNVEKLIHHSYLHLKYRKDILIDPNKIIEQLKDQKLNYKKIYDSIGKALLLQTDKKYWGENCALYWRYIPDFINMFDDAKTIHILRDPRAVFSSWKKLSSIPNNAYLNCIFNWIDSANHIIKYLKTIPSDKYHFIKYEDIMMDPEKELSKLFNFLNLKLETDILDQSKWVEKLEKNNGLIKIPLSAHEGKNIVGFSKERTSNWEKHLEEWEIILIEFLCRDLMEKFEYKPKNLHFKKEDIKKIMEKIHSNDLLINNFTNFVRKGEGSDRYPLNPRDPMTWGAKHHPSDWFKDTENGQNYFKERSEIEKIIDKKYS